MSTYPIPGLLLLPLRLIPDAVHTEIVSRLANFLLQGQSVAARLRDIDGKTLCIRITDADTNLCFTVVRGRLQRAPDRHWDVCIAGSLSEFTALATRSEDPDTLFFNRRLSLEGDTRTGLYVKNLLDSLDFDWERHVTAVLGAVPGSALGKLASTIRSRIGFPAPR